MFPLDEIILPKVYENDLDDIPDVGLGFIKPLVQDELVRKDLWKEAVRAYLANIAFADHCIGVLLDAIETSGKKDNTIIVLMGDHGWHLGEKQHLHKFTLWERSTRVPLVIMAPEVTSPGSGTPRPVELTDLFSTLIELCDLPPVGDLDGVSLVPLLREPQRTWDRAAVTTHGEGNHAVRSERWRYIRYVGGDEELYDHDVDPNEWHNLAEVPQYASVKAELGKFLPKHDASRVKKNKR